MTVPTNVNVGDDTRDALAGLATSDQELLLEGLELRADWQHRSGLDPRTFSLVKVAALVALDAPPASYIWQVSNALDSGCTPDELVGVLRAIAPQVGGPRVVAGAAELMLVPGPRPARRSSSKTPDSDPVQRKGRRQSCSDGDVRCCARPCGWWRVRRGKAHGPASGAAAVRGSRAEPAPRPSRAAAVRGPATPAAAARGAAAPSMYDQLQQLSTLHDQGALTDEEFAAAKAKMLGT